MANLEVSGENEGDPEGLEEARSPEVAKKPEASLKASKKCIVPRVLKMPQMTPRILKKGAAPGS